MGDPVANCYIEDLGNNQVRIVNTSLQGGSFFWDLGDGTLLETGEQNDTLLHTYPDASLYPVTLIAKGCPYKADTLDLIWNWVGIDEMSKQNTYFQINPNPVSSSEMLSVFVGKLPRASAQLQLISEDGKEIATYSVPKSEITLTIPPIAAKGIYFVRLLSEGKLMQIEKLIVQ